MRDEAMHGPAGELVRLLDPHTESDPAALLLQTLAAWGSLIGRGPYYLVEEDRHYTNLYVNLVGSTSKARKGTSWGRVRMVLNSVDEYWIENCLLSGLGSGEVLFDILEGDKRCLISEPELARLLAVMSRDGSTLSAILRDGWDRGDVANYTRKQKQKVSGAHISLIGHITKDELLRRLESTELANGLCNRMLWVCTQRSKLLPHGGGDVKVGDILRKFNDATNFARKRGQTRIQMDDDAKEFWSEIYAGLTEGRPGLLGAVTNRADPQVIRLALNYALLDQSEVISKKHLEAGLAVWDYCYASAQYIWGDAIGDPVADTILAALRQNKNGLTRTDISVLFGKHKYQAISLALAALAEQGRARFLREQTGGRSAERWFAV
jgi:hypothetical protein